MKHPFKIGDLVKFYADGDYGIVVKTKYEMAVSANPVIKIHWLSCPKLNTAHNKVWFLASSFELMKE